MAQAALVEMQIQNGERLLDRLGREGVEVLAASWVKESDGDQWFFYLATPLVGEDGAKRTAYRRVNTVIRAMRKEGFWFDPMEVKLIGLHDPIAVEMVAHRASVPTWFRGSQLGDLPVEEAYLYPPA